MLIRCRKPMGMFDRRPRPCPSREGRRDGWTGSKILRTWRASGELLRGEGAASDELLLVCVGEEGWAGTVGVPAAG
jgi:hypothetical protein